MKFLANLSRILVGLEFIFSGFVKVVDPYGTGLKLQEYFEVFVMTWDFMASKAALNLPFALFPSSSMPAR
jgi:hypothetical protein